MAEDPKDYVGQFFGLVDVTTKLFRQITRRCRKKSLLLTKVEEPRGRKSKTRWRFTIVVSLLIVSLVSGSVLYARYKNGNGGHPPKPIITVIPLDGLFFQSYVLPSTFDLRKIFETLGTEDKSHFPDPKLQAGVSYTGNGATIRPSAITKKHPAYVTTRITVTKYAEFAFSMQFIEMVLKGHFEVALGGDPLRAVAFEIAPDPTSGSITCFAKQAGKYLREAAQSEAPSKSYPERENGTTLTPSTDELWIRIRIDQDTMCVSIPTNGGIKDLVYKLPNAPELEKSTIVDRRSYGSTVLLKYFVAGTSEQVSAVISGSLKLERWPEVRLERDMRAQNTPNPADDRQSHGKRVARR